MKTTRSAKHGISIDEISVPSFGYELIREELLTDILGKDAPEILYWAGKRLARKYMLQNLTDIIAFFEKAGWGQLTVKKETKNQLFLELSSPLIINRIQLYDNLHFKMEAGFLAQQIESQTGVIAEAFEQVQKKQQLVEIIVRWDHKDFINM